MSGWAGALRAARRTAVRAKGRTALVVTLIALPVAVVVAGDTLARTADISVKESLPQTIGAADARISDDCGLGPAQQLPDDSQFGCFGQGSSRTRSASEVLESLPRGSRLLPLSWGADVVIEHRRGVARAVDWALDLSDPLTKGMFSVRSGRVPAGPDEVAVNRTLEQLGFPVGSTLRADGHARTVVGVVRTAPGILGTIAHAPDAYRGDPALVLSTPGDARQKSANAWLAQVPGGVSWQQVLTLNRQGLHVLSRKVVNDPPPESAVPTQVFGKADNSGLRTLMVLVVVLAVLQVVLLAAPAFAVGARRQRRMLAMLGATGAAPKHVRRFVLSQGIVLGSAAGVLGAGLGIAAGVALRPALSLVDRTAGPIDISWRDAGLAAGLGALAAVVAALVPALIAGRQDVLAGLTGRRGTRSGSVRTLVPGVVVLGIGVVGCVTAARPQAGQFTIVYAALPMVLGAALLAPTSIVVLSKRVGALPFSLRYALRDAARSRGRTAAAAAAVTATVAGAVALGIGGASDSLQGRTTYQPSGPAHAVVVTGFSAPEVPAQLATLRTALAERMPGAAQQQIRTLRSGGVNQVTDPANQDVSLLSSFGGRVDGWALVGESALDLLDLSAGDRARAAAGLRRTGAIALVETPSHGPVTVVEQDQDWKVVRRRTLPAYRLVSALHPAPLIVTPAVAAKLGTPVLGGVLVKGDLSKDAERQLNSVLNLVGLNADEERGWQGSDRQRLAMLVLGGAAAVLVLGGTLSAALLALGDARPDFATLMAVGAPPRVRRRVAAGYAAVIGLLGSLLGTVAGLAPGIAVSYPLTRGNPAGFADHYLAIPWSLLIGLAIVVPLTAALGAALLTRSRLPLAARVET